MNGRSFRMGVALAVLALLAVTLGTGAFPPTAAQADRGDHERGDHGRGNDGRGEHGRAGHGRGHSGDDGAIVQEAVLRWRDGWAYGMTPADSTHAEGSLATGRVTLTRRASGIRLEVRDLDTVKHHAYSIWFQVCPEDSVFIDGDTQCSLPKELNMNGSGDVAGPHGLHVKFELAVGTAIGPANRCAFDPAYLTTPCPAWGGPGILAGDVVFTERMALHGPVRIVVKDHGPTKAIKKLGKTLGLRAREALFIATHRTDGPECQPARPVCPDSHVAVFASPPVADIGPGAAGGSASDSDD